MRHVLSVADWTSEDISWILNRAVEWRSPLCRPLDERGPHGALILERASFRTRIAYEGAFHLLGGQLTVFEGGVGTGDALSDVSRVLSNMLDIALVRTRDHAVLERLASVASIPIINALSSREHPVEVLADAMVMRDLFGDPSGRKLAFVGDGGNVCASILTLAPLLGMHVAVASPEGYAPEASILATVKTLADAQGIQFEISSSAECAVKNADVVYTDGWPSLDDPSTCESIFGKYRVTDALMDRAAPNAIFLHCLPARRGREVSDDVLDSERSYAFRRLPQLTPTATAMIEWATSAQSA